MSSGLPPPRTETRAPPPGIPARIPQAVSWTVPVRCCTIPLMDTRSTRTAQIWLLVVLANLATVVGLSAQAPPSSPGGTEPQEQPAGQPTTDQADAQPGPQIDRSSARATMRAFLVAVQNAAGEHPERIADAMQCLDVSGLPEEDRAEQAGKLAIRLEKLIDLKGVNIDDIPESTEEDTFVFHSTTQTVDGEETTLAIELEREPQTERWRFSARTLASIPGLEKAFEQQKEEKLEAAQVESKVDAARRTPRATMKTFLDAMNADPQRIEEAVACLDSSEEDPKSWGVRGPTLAHKLMQVMDRIRLVVLQSIPDKPDDAPHEWYTGITGNIVIARVAEGEFEGEWRFTPLTLRSLDDLHKEFKDRPLVAELQKAGKKEHVPIQLWARSKTPEALQKPLLWLEQWQWIALAVLAVAGYVVHRIVAVAATFLLGIWLRKSSADLDSKVQRRALRPLGLVAMALVWYAGLHLLDLPGGLLDVLLPAAKFVLAVGVVWLVFTLVDLLGGYLLTKEEFRFAQLDVLVPLLCKVLKVVVTLLSIVFIADAMNWRFTSVLATLGLGGLAVAMAARDTIANFFGSITVLLDRPFRVGDWICIGDINGTVEHVGFRSTRVRTFYNSIITIPNSRVVDSHVDNYGLREYRRTSTTISITYSTLPDKIEAFCEGIRELIRLHPYTRKDYYHVYLNKFAASSLDIMLYVFFQAPDWATELRERHRLFLDIIRLAERLGVEFAFPTQTVYLQRGDGAERAPAPGAAEDALALGQDFAAKVFAEAHGEGPVQIPPVVIESAPRSQQTNTTAPDTDQGKPQ